MALAERGRAVVSITLRNLEEATLHALARLPEGSRGLAAPGEVASAVIAAIKHLTFTTGAIIPVDGGRPLS